MELRRNVIVLSCLLLCPIAVLLVVPSAGEAENGMRVRLYHRSELRFPRGLSEAAANNEDHKPLSDMRDVAARDLRRLERMSARISSNTRRRACERKQGSFDAPISSGAYAGVGEYFVKLEVGTPAKNVLLIADTGSDLTWVRCFYPVPGAGETPSPAGNPPPFNGSDSKSFTTITCSSALCKSPLPFSLAACPTPSSPCQYDYQYSSGARSQGFYANETVTVSHGKGRASQIRNVIIGCNRQYDGIGSNVADGILGLGQSASSFTVQAAQMYGGKFSYCLVDHLSGGDVANSLVFGENRQIAAIAGGVRSTPLVLDAAIQPFYGINVKGISISGRKLPIPETAWRFQFSPTGFTNGVIMDSGMTLTALVKPAYDEVMAAFEAYYKNKNKFEFAPFRLCFNTTDIKPTEMRGKEMGPPMVVHLDGGADFSPPVDSYIVPVADGMRCVGILPVPPLGGVSVIGNILQQKHLWEYDLLNAKLRFGPSSCVN